MVIFNGATDFEPSGLASDPRMVELVAEWANQPPERRDQFLQDHLMANLVEQLRRAISNSGESYYALAKRSGVDAVVISRFVAGERDLRLETAAKLADAMGLVLQVRSNHGRK